MKNPHKKALTIILALLLVGALSFVAVSALRGDSNPAKKAADTSKIDPVAEQQTIDEQKSGDKDPNTDNQTDNSDGNQQNAPDDNTKNTVSVVITSPQAYIDSESASLNGYVADVVESGGTCTLKMTDNAGKSVKSSRPAEPDATTTTCGQSSIKLSALHSGKWIAVLSYSSKTSFGKSSEKTVAIP